MKLVYEGAEITDKMTTITHCELNQYLDGHIDTMTIAFDNSQGQWTGWAPKRGDKLQASDDHADSGIMVVTAVRQEGAEMVLDCAPLLNHQIGQVKGWKNASFTQLARNVGTRLGLAVKFYDVTDQKYEGIEQKGESDLIFLSNLCKLEGCSMIVSDGTLRIMSDAYLDSLELSDYTLQADSCRITDKDLYTGCEVSDGKTTGMAGTNKGEKAYFSTDRKLESIGQANRFATNMLRYANRDRKCGSILCNSVLDTLMPGSKIKITNDYWKDKPVIITRARYYLIKQQTKLWFSLLGDE